MGTRTRAKHSLSSIIAWTLLSLAVIVIALRLMLPWIVTSYINNVLSDIPGYQGHIDGVDISLLRGAYVIHNIQLQKRNGDVPVPFFSAPRIGISIEWPALFDGSLVGEIEFVHPSLNFVHGRTNHDTQDGSETSFLAPIKKLFPLKFNRFDITNGEVHYRDFHSSPNVDLILDSLNVRATNLTNSKRLSKTLVASIDARGYVMGKGVLQVHLDIDPYTPQPTFGLKLELEHVQLVEVNDFFKAYASITVASGTFSIYSEMAGSNGAFNGYVKSLFKHMQVRAREKNENPVEMLWRALVATVARILTNPSQDQIATTVPLSGRFDDPSTDVLSTIGGLLKNAFIQALQPGIEGNVRSPLSGAK